MPIIDNQIRFGVTNITEKIKVLTVSHLSSTKITKSPNYIGNGNCLQHMVQETRRKSDIKTVKCMTRIQMLNVNFNVSFFLSIHIH